MQHNAEKLVCMPSYLATGEDERRCDDQPVFDKCVFHLVGEWSAEGKKSERVNRGGEERGSGGKV